MRARLKPTRLLRNQKGLASGGVRRDDVDRQAELVGEGNEKSEEVESVLHLFASEYGLVLHPPPSRLVL